MPAQLPILNSPFPASASLADAGTSGSAVPAPVRPAVAICFPCCLLRLSAEALELPMRSHVILIQRGGLWHRMLWYVQYALDWIE